MTKQELEELEILPTIVKGENLNGKMVSKIVCGTYVFYKDEKYLVKGVDLEEGLIFTESDNPPEKSKTIRFENAYNPFQICTGEAKTFLSKKNNILKSNY